jgi:branched-chain amino acid transport system ATP-binding protein
MSAVIELQGLEKSFGGIVVADNVTLEIRRGEILGLIGPNGAGKTSLFNLISGIVKPDAGTISFNGQIINAMSIPERVRLGLSRTWQNIRLFGSMSVIDNLLIGPRHYEGESLWQVLFRPRLLDRARAAYADRAFEVLELVGLARMWNAPVGDLPHGQQKLVGLARALMNDGDCLLLDEPMAGVEGQAYQAMQRVVRDAAASGKAVCVVEHNVSFIKDLCDHAVFMFAGKIIASGTVDELIADEQLTELYFGA